MNLALLPRSLWAFAIGVVAAVVLWLPTRADANVCSITGTANAKVAPVGGTGTYSFQSLEAVCYAPPSILDISSNGTFSNKVCGTGHASSSTIGVTAVPPDPTMPKDLSYTIDFTAGAGTLTFRHASGGGLVYITPDPQQPGGLDGNCTDGFKVAGTIYWLSPLRAPPV